MWNKESPFSKQREQTKGIRADKGNFLCKTLGVFKFPFNKIIRLYWFSQDISSSIQHKIINPYAKD